MHKQRVVIVGGGIAGLAAAVHLARHDLSVTLIETSKRLGGRASSYTDPATGDVYDNCQHVVMRACTALLGLYDTLGVEEQIVWHRTMHLAGAPGEPVDELTPDDLPAPLHLTRPLMQMQMFTWSEKLAIARGMFAILQVSRKGRAMHADQPFRDWLAEHHQPAAAIEHFWRPILVSTCNETLDRISTKYAIQVVQEGMLRSDDASEMGLSDVPLAELYEPARRIIEAAGGKVLMGASAERLVPEHDRVARLELADADPVDADTFILCVPPDRLSKLCTPELLQADERLQRLDDLETSPIVGIHLLLQAGVPGNTLAEESANLGGVLSGGASQGGSGTPEAVVMKLPHLMLTHSPLHWIFNKGLRTHEGRQGQHLHLVASAARELVDQSAEELVELAVREVQRFVPALREGATQTMPLRVLHSRVIKEKRATFSAKPGVDALRPSITPTRHAMPNLYLAGDWVDTGWPATMEGAARSGLRAAAAVLGTSADPVEDAEPGLLYRLLSA